MRTLISIFQVKEAANRTSFEVAWDTFVEALESVSPDTKPSRLLTRIPSSGYDTDTDRQHAFLTTITFPDAAEADRVWKMIEERSSALSKAHVAMLRLTKDQLFTFWGRG